MWRGQWQCHVEGDLVRGEGSLWLLLSKAWLERIFQWLTMHGAIHLYLAVKYTLNIPIDIDRLTDLLKYKVRGLCVRYKVWNRPPYLPAQPVRYKVWNRAPYLPAQPCHLTYFALSNLHDPAAQGPFCLQCLLTSWGLVAFPTCLTPLPYRPS